MKIYFDKRLKDPTYYGQQGFRNGKKLTSRNIMNFSIEYMLDEERISEEKKYDGYSAVATNLDDPAKDILAVIGKRYQIEDCFRIMKTNFNGRPVNYRLNERIRAHFLICYTALLVYRLLEAKLHALGADVTTDYIISTLRNMNVANIHDFEYMALYNGSDALDAFVKLTMMPLDRLHYRPKELNAMIKKFYHSFHMQH